jgi:hypothetical protein
MSLFKYLILFFNLFQNCAIEMTPKCYQIIQQEIRYKMIPNLSYKANGFAFENIILSYHRINTFKNLNLFLNDIELINYYYLFIVNKRHYI